MKFDGKTSRDPLDDLLAQARWDEPSAASRTRLQETWRGLTQRSRAAVWRWSASAAAVVVIGIGGAWLAMQLRTTRPTLAVAPSPPPATPIVRQAVTWRAVTARDVLLMRLADRERGAAAAAAAAAAAVSATAPAAPPTVDPAAIAAKARRTNDAVQRRQLLAALIDAGESSLTAYLEFAADPATKADALAALRSATTRPVDALFAQMRSPRADLRVAAASVLGEINGPQVTQKLIGMIAAEENRREAFLALASCRGEEARDFLRRAAQSEALSSFARSAMAQTEVH